MHELFEKMRRHRVNIDGNVSTVMFTTLVLEVSLNLLSFRGTAEKTQHANLRFKYKSSQPFRFYRAMIYSSTAS